MDAKRRDVFQAIADPVRRDIIGLLARESMSVNAVAGNFAISRPAISKHLRILRECGLIQMEQKGRERHCRIQPQNLAPVADWVEPFRKLWEEKLDRFEAYLSTLKEEDTQDESDT
ncbi:MAG: metalloregulator ArsR/SmtB family transcription factor [Bacteroidota bacterium]